MADFDSFATQLLEEAKRFLEKGQETSDPAAEVANLHAALMLSFCALEAHVNAVSDEFSGSNDLSVHERAMLLEKDVRLENGQFRLQAGLRMSRLEDRIDILHAKFSGSPVDRSSLWWSGLQEAMNLRNQLTHAKAVPAIKAVAVRSATLSIIDTLNALYLAIYKKKFPAAGQGLSSQLNF